MTSIGHLLGKNPFATVTLPPSKASRDAVLRYLGKQALPIYDPFCGGGSIPLEAQRLGMRAIGSDLNPVAVLITKALVELPPKFANYPPINPAADPMGMTVGKGKKARKVPWRGAAGIAADIRYYGHKMREMAEEHIGNLYPKAKLSDGSEATVIAWLWARTVPCPNPACGIQMPMIRNFQISKRPGNQCWIKPVVDMDSHTIAFEVQDSESGVPSSGTVNRNGTTCISCGVTSPLAYAREQVRAGNMREQMTAVVAEGDKRRLFVSPTEEHIQAAISATPDISSIPQQKIPTTAYLVSGRGYGITHWSQLFNNRQLTALSTFSHLMSEIRTLLVDTDGADTEYADAICTYLALVLGRDTSMRSSFTVWENSGHKVAGVFGRQAIPMVWDYPEGNPFSNSSGNWMAQIEWVARVVANLPEHVNPGNVYQADASTTIHAEKGPVIVTDPPYYDNISYAELSDFFYVWLRPLLRDIYPGLFAGILVPTEEEMIAAPRFENARERFEQLLNQTLQLIRTRCSSDFPSSIFYAYKQQEEEREGRTSTGWDTMLTALVNAGFEIVGTWPMRTERAGGLKANVNVLASSVILVCRPRSEDAPIATRRQFLNALEAELPSALDQLTREGHIAPVDLAQAAIGPGMQIYSRYSRVETISGEPVTVREALANINRVIAEYDEQQQGELDSATRFCLDWLRQNGYKEGRYGEAETLAQAKNVAVEELRDGSRLLIAESGAVKLLPMEEYSPDRPIQLGDMTAWEGAFRIAYHLTKDDEGGKGIEGASGVYRMMGSSAESVERLARILYNHYDRKNDSANSVMFNSLVTEWAAIQDRALDDEQETQGDLV